VAYYQGDYYMGDYYKGDPFLGLGAIFGAAKWIGKKIFKKGVGKAIATRGTALSPAEVARRFGPGFGGGALVSILGNKLMVGGRTHSTLNGQLPRPGMKGRIQRLLPGGQSGMMCRPGQYMKVVDGEEVGCATRRMNVANPQALRRSLRRVAGFGKLACRARTDIQRAAAAVGAGGSSRGRSRSCVRRKKCA